MITRIEIDGFKSFRQFSLDLDPFQVIVGLNAAGKSNLLDAIRFLAKVVASSLPTAYQEMWAETGELFTILPDGSTVNRMSFALECLLKPQAPWWGPDTVFCTRVRYELSIHRTDANELTLAHEGCVSLHPEHDPWGRSHSNVRWEDRFLYAPDTDLLALKATSVENGIRVPVMIHLRDLKDRTILGRHPGIQPPVSALSELLSNVSFLHIEPEAVRLPTSSLGLSRLDSTGKYLANVLARMCKQDPYLLASVSAELSGVVSGLVRVEVEEDRAHGHNVVWAYTSEGKRTSLRELSDGTLRLLALAVLRHDPELRGLLLLEEPENGVHPFRVKVLAQLLRTMATDFSQEPVEGEPYRQVLLTTHSPALVSQLGDNELVFAHTADIMLDGQSGPLRTTRMSSLKNASSPAQRVFTKREILRYLDEKDLERRSERIRRETP